MAKHFYAIEMGTSLLTGRPRANLACRFDSPAERDRWIGNDPAIRRKSTTMSREIKSAMRFVNLGFTWPVRI